MLQCRLPKTAERTMGGFVVRMLGGFTAEDHAVWDCCSPAGDLSAADRSPFLEASDMLRL